MIAAVLALPTASFAQVKVIISGGFSAAYREVLPEVKITYNAETAEPAEKMLDVFLCSASSAFNVVFLHKIQESPDRRQ